MNRTQLACIMLTASAFVLAGLLLFTLNQRDQSVLSSEARAALALNKGDFTLLTASTRGDEEALFVIDSLNERLLIYALDLRQDRIEKLHAPIPLPELFAAAGGGRRR